MCRNIKTLFNFDPPATDQEIRAASLQFVRKISGFTNLAQLGHCTSPSDRPELPSSFPFPDNTTLPPRTRSVKSVPHLGHCHFILSRASCLLLLASLDVQN